MHSPVFVIHSAAFGRRSHIYRALLGSSAFCRHPVLAALLLFLQACESGADTSPAATIPTACIASNAKPVTFIGNVQGEALQSPKQGQELHIQGIVTHVVAGSGFYLQEAQTESDQNPLTSDALWIEPAGNRLPNPADQLLVSGMVQELSDPDNLTDLATDTHTALTSAAWTTCATGREIPLVTVSDAMDHEAFEHMHIQLQGWRVSGRDRDQIRLSHEELFYPTQTATPGRSADRIAEKNKQASLYIASDRRYEWRAGDQVNVRGLVVANANKPWLDMYTRPTIIKAKTLPEVPPKAKDTLRVVSMNIENLFNGNGKGGGFPTRRGARSVSDYTRQLDQLVTAVERLQADILAVMELENDGYQRYSTIAQFAEALNAENQDRNWQFIQPGTSRLGDDVIAVGLLFDANQVQAEGTAQSLTERPFDGLSRVPLAQQFSAKTADISFWLAVNHFKSKGGCPRGQGKNADNSDAQGCWNEARERSSLTLSRWLKSLQRSSKTDSVMLVGDLNSYRMEDPIRALVKSRWIDLVDHYSPVPVYSYRYQGQMGTLDYAFGNQQMLDLVDSAAVWNINSDAMNRNQSEAFSDHDPIIIDIGL